MPNKSCPYQVRLYYKLDLRYMSFAKSWLEKGCGSQAETWQLKNILMKDFDRQAQYDVFVVSMAT